MSHAHLFSLNSQNKKYFYYFLIAIIGWFILFQDKFFSFITPMTYTGWDTHGMGFRNFLYFRDSLAHGIIPLWNPFIQSGTIFHNLNNVGFFYPFEFFFVALGLVIDPLLAFELLVQSIIAIGGFGAFLLFKKRDADSNVAFFGAMIFSVVILSPMVGQAGYMISFSAIPWLLLACLKLCDRDRMSSLKWALWAILFVFYLAAGYLWLNIIILMMMFLYAVLKIYSRESRLGHWKFYKFHWFSEPAILLLIGIGILLGIVMLPAFLNMRFNYSQLVGDFISFDGRLRGLKNMGGGAGHGGGLETLIGNIDPLISKNQPWWKDYVFNYGAGWTLWMLFVLSLYLRWTKEQLFWLVIVCLALVYSAGGETSLGKLISYIPVVSANRYWLGVGTSFASIGLCFLVVDRVSAMSRGEVDIGRLSARIVVISLGAYILLFLLYSPPSLYILVTANAIFIWLACKTRSADIRLFCLGFLIFLNILGVVFSTYRAGSNPTLDAKVQKEITERNSESFYGGNTRKFDEGTFYNYWDADWLYKKLPFNHGYNNLGSPQYWYVKSNPLLKQLIYVSQDGRQADNIERTREKNDNEFLERVARDVLSAPLVPTIERNKFSPIDQNSNFDQQITNIELEPNQISFIVQVSHPAHVYINSVYAPGWHLLVNGSAKEQFFVNRIFTGFDLPSAGTYHVRFFYRPYFDIFCLAAPYSALLLWFLIRRFCNSSKD